MDDGTKPANGDVVITTDRGTHFLSIFPNPHRLSFGVLERAYEIARMWAASQHVEIWHLHDDRLTKLARSRPDKSGTADA